MRLIPHENMIEIECETPLERTVMLRWEKCDAVVERLFDYGVSGPTGSRGVYIRFTPKNDQLLPSPSLPPETGEAGFRG